MAEGDSSPAGDTHARAPGGWFLGPRAENAYLLSELIGNAIDRHCDMRVAYQSDPEIITPAVKASPAYKNSVARLRAEASALNDHLVHSAPLFSMRSHGHMHWDHALPGTIGYFSALLYNQNNVAAEASPVTTWLEGQVSDDLCKMLGFGRSEHTPAPWAHITCGGSVANIESLWAARNAKFYPLAVKAALLADPLFQTIARDVPIRLASGERRPLVDLGHWDLLNIVLDDALALPYAIAAMLPQMDKALDRVSRAIRPFTYQEQGPLAFYRHHLPADAPAPTACAPATAHYSWPKAASLLGLGPLRKIAVDLSARMDLDALRRELEACLASGTPVLSVVAVIGSTEESSVDPLEDILLLRDEFRQRGLDFVVHCDAAWGGYLACSLPGQVIPTYPLGPYVRRQYAALGRADTITVDPHKAGYVPYPAGALCYRNIRMRDCISLKSPVVMHDEAEPSVGVYGIEGSKPGAAVAAVYLAHRTIGLDIDGYGQIHGQCIWTSKRLYARLLTMFDRDARQPSQFRIAMFQRLPSEVEGGSEASIAAQRSVVASFVPMTNDALVDRLASPDEHEARDLFASMGSDQVIINYAFNFRDSVTQRWNEDVDRCNALNEAVFKRCSVDPTYRPDHPSKQPDLIITSSAYDEATYGTDFLSAFGARLGLTNTMSTPVTFLISTTMNPWPTETSQVDFLAVIEEELRTSVTEAAARLGFLSDKVEG